jgi:hypothetical protein
MRGDRKEAFATTPQTQPAYGGCQSTLVQRFVRQVFTTTRTLPFFSAENVALHLPLEAGAQRTLAAVACRPLLASSSPDCVDATM